MRNEHLHCGAGLLQATCYTCERRIALQPRLIQHQETAPTPFKFFEAAHLKSFVKVIHALLLLVVTLPLSVSRGDPLMLWYSKPGKTPMTEGLPIGNGRLGALLLGGVEQDRIVLNEDSLWTGNENPSGDYDSMGAYQMLGELVINLSAKENFSAYRRTLDLDDALATVSYQMAGVRYEREFFCSHPSGLFVAKFSADKPGQYSGTITAKDSHQAPNQGGDHQITLTGHLQNGMQYGWKVKVIPQGGKVFFKDSALVLDHCDGFVMLVGAGTDYSMTPETHYFGSPSYTRIFEQMEKATALGYAELKARHLQDFHSFSGRVSLDVGRSKASQEALPTDERRLAAFHAVDPELEAVLFQYGRYLLTSCSRPGGLPANLQGLWNDSNDPPWHSDYHANINIQMNYWPAEVANLSECHLPLFDLVTSQLPAWRTATRSAKELNIPSGSPTARGFAVRTSHNITGGMGWKWDKTANAWYCQHFWEHYIFTGDTQFLSKVAYPVMRETCQYWEDHLKRLPDGHLVVPNGWSPEHGPDEDGVSYNQEIVWDLFNNYVQACDVLGVDRAYRDQIAAMRDQLVTPKVGSWGQLLEWMTEKKGARAVPGSPELDTPNDHHRHTSHLFGVYPGRQFTVAKTPAMAAAARVSLEARGIAPNSDVREWSFAWRSALYARLHDGDAAHRMLQQLFSDRNTSPNLFGLHPPVQLDGNFGITAAVCEMLLQSQTGDLELLPALPGAWPEGQVIGLRARGAFTVDLKWRAGKLVEVSVHNLSGKPCKVRYDNHLIELKTAAGQTARLSGDLTELK